MSSSAESPSPDPSGSSSPEPVDESLHDFMIDVDQEASAHIDLYALHPSEIAEPPVSLRHALWQIGPGLILAGSIVGTGELIATTGLGAKVGYSMLWLILLSCLIKVFLQIELGRHAITHGQTTLAAFNSLPGPRVGAGWMCWFWLFMMLTTLAQNAAMEGLVGQAAHLAFPGASRALANTMGAIVPAWGTFLDAHPEHFWAGLTALAAVLLLLSGGYRRLEKITTILVVFVTMVTMVCVLGLPLTPYPVKFDELAQGFTFSIPAAGVALAFSAFGITGVGASELFAYPYWCIEKGYARAAGRRSPSEEWVRRARGWMRVMKLDAWCSMVVYTLATVAFYLLGAAVLHPQGIQPQGAEMLKQLSAMYQPALGNWTVSVFLLGAWAVLFKTLYVSTAANGRLFADFLNLAGIWTTSTPPQRDHVVKAFCIISPAIAFGLYVLLREPRFLVMIGGTAQALMLPLIAGATLYLRRRDADPRVAPSLASDVFCWLAASAITIVAAYSLLEPLFKR